MGKLVGGAVLLVIAFALLLAAATVRAQRPGPEVARLQAEQQRLLNQTLSPDALTKQWIEVLHDMKSSNNLVIFVPTEGGLPLLNISEMRKNLKP